MFAVWTFCLAGQAFIVKLDFIFSGAIAGFTLAVVCLMTFMCLNPFK